MRDLDHPTSGTIKAVGPPWISSAEEAPSTAPPLLGEHTGEVLREWLGWDDPKITAFDGRDDAG